MALKCFPPSSQRIENIFGGKKYEKVAIFLPPGRSRGLGYVFSTFLK